MTKSGPLPTGPAGASSANQTTEVKVPGGVITFPPGMAITEAQANGFREAFTPKPDPVTYESIMFTRHLGHPLTIDNAPEYTKISLGVLADHRVYIHEMPPGHLVIADQVEYLVTGYDPADCTLMLQLVKDHRPQPEPEPAP